MSTYISSGLVWRGESLHASSCPAIAPTVLHQAWRAGLAHQYALVAGYTICNEVSARDSRIQASQPMNGWQID